MDRPPFNLAEFGQAVRQGGEQFGPTGEDTSGEFASSCTGCSSCRSGTYALPVIALHQLS